MAANLKHVEGRVVVKADMTIKDSHTFEDGTKIYLGREFNNLDVRYTKTSQGEVVDSEYIPVGATVLFHPNATHDSNKIFNYEQLSGNEVASDIKYFSIPEEEIYLYRIGEGDYQPLKGFDTALRVYKPYTGILHGIEPSLIPNTLYVTSGEYKGKAVLTVKAADYVLIFQESNGREGRLIRFRPLGDEKTKREPEAIAILWDITKQIENGELLVGVELSDAKPLNENAYHHV